MKRKVSDKQMEHGAVAVTAALIAVVLIGVGALGIDIGRIAEKRAQLQNSADAGALAAATSCASSFTNNCPTAGFSAADTQAQNYALANLRDGTMKHVATTFPDQHTVQIVTSTPDAGLAMTLARALGISSEDVTARAQAAWGGPNTGPGMIPLALNPCQFDLTSTAPQSISITGPSCKPDSSQSGTMNGGFAWLAPDAGTTCQATVQLDSSGRAYIDGANGVSAAKSCKTIGSFVGKDILIPVWSSYDPKMGKNGRYYIEGFAAFHLVGYSFPAASPKSGGDTTGLGGKLDGIRGYFLQMVVDPSLFGGNGYEGGGVSLPPHLIK